jgi:hypothetical protein
VRVLFGVRGWVHGVVAGATAGVLAEVLVLRLNPEILQGPGAVLEGVPAFATWGALLAGVPLLALLAVVGRLRRAERWWPAPQLFALVYVVAAVMSRVNAALHPEYLPPSGHRILGQDAVAWLIAALLALVGGSLVTRLGGGKATRVTFAALLFVAPLVRLIWQPTPPLTPLDVVARPLGQPARPLLVIGLEGFDSRVLLSWVGDGRYRTLSELEEGGAWAPLSPYRPFLGRSLWTSLATGTLPGRHGVKSHWGWRLPWLGGQTLRLLPWTPQGSRLILPWGLAERVVPPPASVPPLWERLRVSGVATAVYGWPGIWGDDVTLERVPREDGLAAMEPAIRVSLTRALAPFSAQRPEVWRAVLSDQARVDGAHAALAAGDRDVWIHLQGLGVARRELEPLKPMHTREREVLSLVLELVDVHLERLLSAVAPDTLVVVVSPYGLEPPGSWERLRRLLGIGGTWRMSAEGSPDGLLLLRGVGVRRAARFGAVRVTDVAPTVCYLLGLPVAQYMEGRVLVEAVEPEFLATHPLRIVD